MALTRAQLLMSSSAEGTVLAGQSVAVRAGAGLTISPLGVISIDVSPSSNIFIKTNNNAAANSYVWPNAVGTAGQQLTLLDNAGTLTWAESDGIPWTAKGQLIVGTGIGTDVLLNPGTDTSVLVANSASAAGAAWSNVVTSAIQLPAGTSANQPATPAVGMIRYNTTNNEFEGYSGSPAQWQALGGMPTGGGTDKIFYENGQIITTNYTVGPNENAMTAGSIVVNAGVTVTISPGSTWTVV
jgi:hypothetical protein